MSTPQGLRKPRRAVFLIPILLVLALVGAAAIYGLYQIGWQTAHPSVEVASRLTAVKHGPRPLQGEILFGAGVVVLFIAMAWGAWRYHSRPKALDRVTAERTREMYQRSPRSRGSR